MSAQISHFLLYALPATALAVVSIYYLNKTKQSELHRIDENEKKYKAWQDMIKFKEDEIKSTKNNPPIPFVTESEKKYQMVPAETNDDVIPVETKDVMIPAETKDEPIIVKRDDETILFEGKGITGQLVEKDDETILFEGKGITGQLVERNDEVILAETNE